MPHLQSANHAVDLIIVGAGVVGSTLALALCDTGLQIALIEARASLPKQSTLTALPHDDQRLFALSDTSCQFLKQLTLWPSLSEQATPIHQVHISKKGCWGALRLRNDMMGLESLGYLIPAAHLQHVLAQHLTQTDNITIYRPAILSKIQQHTTDGEMELTLRTPEGSVMLYSKRVIAADGMNSTVRKQLAIPTQTLDYHQSAIVTQTQLSRFHQYIAYERFNIHGALAMLPLGKERCATIWSADHRTIARLQALSDPAFLQTLQKTMGDRLGQLQSIGPRYIFPLCSVQIAPCAYTSPVLFIGNAAQTLHPIAAQGFNIALYEVAALARSIQTTCAKGLDVTLSALQKVSLSVKKQQAFSLKVSHHLGKYIHPPSILKSSLLQWGLFFLDKSVFLKKCFIQKFLGKI